jgi:hypothetical protein
LEAGSTDARATYQQFHHAHNFFTLIAPLRETGADYQQANDRLVV